MPPACCVFFASSFGITVVHMVFFCLSRCFRLTIFFLFSPIWLLLFCLLFILFSFRRFFLCHSYMLLWRCAVIYSWLCIVRELRIPRSVKALRCSGRRQSKRRHNQMQSERERDREKDKESSLELWIILLLCVIFNGPMCATLFSSIPIAYHSESLKSENLSL